MSEQLLVLLREALARMEDATEGESDDFGLGCGNCDAGTPTHHSFGCRVRDAIHRAERRGVDTALPFVAGEVA